MKRAKSDYRQLLKQHLFLRQQANSSYSLRAFSRDLGLSPSLLSQVLAAKKGLSMNKASAIADRLSLPTHEQKKFMLMVAASDARSKKARDQAAIELASLRSSSSKPRQLNHDVFAAISGWHHFAIMELCKLPAFRLNAANAAKKLGLSSEVTRDAIERLTRLGLLALKNERYELVHASNHVLSDVPSTAIQATTLQLMEKAKRAVTFQSLDEREISTLTFAMNSKGLPLLKAKIREINRQFDEDVSSRSALKRANEVYCFSTQLFRLTERP